MFFLDDAIVFLFVGPRHGLLTGPPIAAVSVLFLSRAQLKYKDPLMGASIERTDLCNSSPLSLYLFSTCEYQVESLYSNFLHFMLT